MLSATSRSIFSALNRRRGFPDNIPIEVGGSPFSGIATHAPEQPVPAGQGKINAVYSFFETTTRTAAVDESFTIDQMQSLALGVCRLYGADIEFMIALTAGAGRSMDGQRWHSMRLIHRV